MRLKPIFVVTLACILVASLAISGHGESENPLDSAIQQGSNGQFDLAKSTVEHVLKLDPWNERAKELLRLANEAIVAKADSETIVHLFRAAQLRNKGSLDRTFSEIDLAMKRSPDYALVYLHRGNARLANGTVESAIADYDRAISLDSSDAVAYYNRGVAYVSKRQYSNAIADFSKAIALDPTDVASYKNRGNANQVLGKHDEALADYDSAIAINPRDAHAFYNRAEEWSRSGQYDKAIADYGKAIELDNDFAEAYDSRGFVYLVKLGKTQLACADWKRACELGRCRNYNLAKSKGYCK